MKFREECLDDREFRRGSPANLPGLIILHHKSLSLTAATLIASPEATTLGGSLQGKTLVIGSNPILWDPPFGRQIDEAGRPAAVLNIATVMNPPDATTMRRVLLVEDDDDLRRNYETLLGAHRLSVCACATKDEAIAAFGREAFDVVILDVTLGRDYEAGFDLCQAFREKKKTTPIIFLTERNEDHDRISGLRLGADDYLTKTISGTFLAARINTLIRRVEALTAAASVPAVGVSQPAGSPLRIDERLSRASWHGAPLDLSLTQFWILKDLFEHAGEVRSTTDLMRAAQVTVQPNTIVVHIKTIREEIQKITPNFSCIKSERARGYRWVDNP